MSEAKPVKALSEAEAEAELERLRADILAADAAYYTRDDPG